MKKRILMVLMVMVLAASFIYAENNVFFATVSPYSLQNVDTAWDTSYVSEYGWGAKVGYRRFVGPFLFGVDLEYQDFIQPTTKNLLTNVRLLGKMGGKLIGGENCDVNGDIGFGVEMAISKHVINFLPVLAGSCSISSFVNPTTAFVMGTDFSVTWPKTTDSTYKATIWNLGFTFGVECDF